MPTTAEPLATALDCPACGGPDSADPECLGCAGSGRIGSAPAPAPAPVEPAPAPAPAAGQIQCLFVRLLRAEGMHHECDGWHTLTGRVWPIRISPIVETGSMLSRWGVTAPDDGTYDKCDFEVKWADGSTYSGRFDLQRGGTDGGMDFTNSLASRLKFYSGRHCPDQMTPDSYAMIMRHSKEFMPGGSENCGHILDNCEL